MLIFLHYKQNIRGNYLTFYIYFRGIFLKIYNIIRGIFLKYNTRYVIIYIGDTMLERKFYQQLLEWKKNKKKQCLLVKGARQVGKTYIIEKFAKENYTSYIYINFELQPEYKKIFDGNLDYDTLIMQLDLYFPTVKIIPNETLLFLDEIQSCPNARVSLKSFAIANKIDVISSGSLLGLYYKEVSSYPVGYEKELELYPLDFEEFLWAIGINKNTISYVREAFNKKKQIEENIIEKFNEYFKLFIIIGGMPQVVNDYITNKSISSAIDLQKQIINLYKSDVLKYQKENEKQNTIMVFQSIPSQLAKKNKKFQYNIISNTNYTVGEKKYFNSIEWIKDAGIINFCFNLQEPAIPLEANKRMDCYKIYMRDTGLLLAMMETGIQKSIYNENLYINEGGIIENICASELNNHYGNLYYFEKKSKLEIDFIANINGIATAIEIKSGNNRKAKSLQSIIDNYKTVKRYIKFENINNIYIEENNIEHYPLFMIMFIK